MKKLVEVFSILYLLFSVNLYAQEECSKIKIGSELDMFPYITSGYYASLWAGTGHMKLRAVVAESNIPEFVVEDGFKDMHTSAYALITDYFFSDDYSGLWVGTGVEYWKNKVKTSDSHVEGNFDNIQLTFGGGYCWKLWKNLYINPWAALHIKCSGDKTKLIDEKTYNVKALLYEASLKFGWYF